MQNIKKKLVSGELVPFLGMGVFKDTVCSNGTTLPFDSDSFSLALNNGRAMSPRLMYEYSRVAMSLEQRKGRDYIIGMTNHIYASKEYEIPFVYGVLKTIKPKYLIDTNLDDSSTKVYEDMAHFMVTGVSRIMAGYDRFIVYLYDVESKTYNQIEKDKLNDSLPIIFKPMGCMNPNKDFIVSDADFVDWLTEAMGGYGLPPFLKDYKKGKSYLFMGVDFSRDTYRMVANEITLDLVGGYVVDGKEELSKKEEKFIKIHNLVLIKNDIGNFLKDL